MTWRKTLTSNALPYIVCALPILLYQALYANGFYPITEGWFSEYAHLIRLGQMPYRDFPLLMPPLYVLQIAAFQTIFGEGLFALHVLGMLVTCAIALALCDLMCQFFDPWVSALAAAVGTIYYQSGVAYIGYDFTQFLTLYILAGGVCLVRAIGQPARMFRPAWQVASLWSLGGFFLGLALLTKQSNAGVALLAMIFACAIAAVVRNGLRGATVRMATFSVGFLVPIALLAVWVVSIRALQPFYNDVFLGATAAKGGLNIALFGWVTHFLHDPPGLTFYLREALVALMRVLGIMIAIAFVLEIAGELAARRRPTRKRLVEMMKRAAGLERYSKESSGTLIAGIALAALCLFAIAVERGLCTSCGSLIGWGAAVQESQYVWAVGFYVLSFVVSLVFLLATRGQTTAKFFILSALGVGLTFGNGTSAGLSEISAFIAVTVFFAFLIDRWQRYMIPALLPVAIAFSFSILFIEKKFEAPYSWWLMGTPPVRSTDCARTTGILWGLCIAPDNAGAIMRLEKTITENSLSGDPIYVYPHMPILYLLSKRPPFDNAVVSWFDFTTYQLAYDVSRRLRTDPPRVVVMAEIPEVVIASHEHAFHGGKPLAQRRIVSAVSDLELRGVLHKVETERLDGLTINVYVKKRPRPKVVVSGKEPPKNFLK